MSVSSAGGMLVVPDFVFWLGFVVILVGAGELVRRAVRSFRGKRTSAVLFGIGAVGLVVAAVLVRRHTYDAVVVVDDGNGGVHAERMLTIGEPDHDPAWRYARDPTWIINRSARSVFLELVDYDHKVLVSPSEIKPGSVSVDERVDHIGPDDAPKRTSKPVLWLRWNR